MISVLSRYGGIQSQEDADYLLNQGEYRKLSDVEAKEISANWTGSHANNQQPTADTNFSPQAQTDVPFHLKLSLSQPAPFMVPNLPPQGVIGRNRLLANVVNKLQIARPEIEVPPVALKGMGGIGKTIMSLAVGRLPEMQTHFPDGILWVELGPEPDVRVELEKWGRALGIDLIPEQSTKACQERLQGILHQRRVLLIVDDVWQTKHGRFFTNLAGVNGRTIITTRELDIAQDLALRENTLKVDVLEPAASLQLLTHIAPEVAIHQNLAKKLCARLEHLPLGITLAGK
ncbi:MAG: hypothetical protein F6K62_23020, partial [Sphaerospermopsis sp. SIO1G2]|nr:hypothetical protein [Sphaerospermopsis sp. SIO1G2]